MIDIVPLDSHLKRAILNSSIVSELVPQQHPVWVDVLNAIGEDCWGLVAIENSQPIGWLFFTISVQPIGTVVNSMPFIAYGGPTTLEGDPRAVAPLLQAFLAEARRLGADVLSLGSSPWLSEQLESVFRNELQVTYEYENFVHLQELVSHPLAQLTKKRRSAFRSEINRAKQAGLKVRSTLTETQFLEWLEIYKSRYQEIDARPYPDIFHQKVFDLAVPVGAAQFWGVFDGEQLVGGNLFLISGKYVDYFSSAFKSEYRYLYPNTYLLNEAFDTFIGCGIRFFNWQSSPNRNGVFQYKARWGARESRHFYFSVLINPDTSLLKNPISDVRSLFPFRFVMPFSAWNQP